MSARLTAASRWQAKSTTSKRLPPRAAPAVNRAAPRKRRAAAWAVKHGSDLLKARIDEGFEWENLAEREFGLSVVSRLGLGDPNDVDDDYRNPEVSERTTPTLAEIQKLREARKALEGQSATAELRWLKYEPKVDDYGDPLTEPMQRTELLVTVTCPNGEDKDFWFPLAEQPA